MGGSRNDMDHPVATIAYYGPNDRVATCVAVGIMQREGGTVERRAWHVRGTDARLDEALHEELFRFVVERGVAKVTVVEGIVGCPHEAAADHPAGIDCPLCPFWAAHRSTGESAH